MEPQSALSNVHRAHRGNGEQHYFGSTTIIMDNVRYPHSGITGKIISSAIEVHKTLGPGLLESVYEEALAHEFDLREIQYTRQEAVSLQYKGKEVGHHRPDFVVEDQVVLEVKAADGMPKIFEAQLLTYLNATAKKVGLIINFNVMLLKEGIKRLVL